MSRWTRIKDFYRKPIVKKTVTLGIIIGGIFGSVGGFYLVSMLVLQTPTPYTVVVSESMVPTLNVGDLVIVQGVPEDSIQVGDIIIFYTDFWGSSILTYPVIHRVVDIYEGNETVPVINQPANNNSYYNGRWFKTKGDNNFGADSNPTPYFYNGRVQVLGRMIFKIPYVGLPQVLLTSLGGQWFIIFLIGILIFFLIFLTLTDTEDEKKQDGDLENKKNDKST